VFFTDVQVPNCPSTAGRRGTIPRSASASRSCSSTARR
jgi:hypothetical protein